MKPDQTSRRLSKHEEHVSDLFSAPFAVVIQTENLYKHPAVSHNPHITVSSHPFSLPPLLPLKPTRARTHTHTVHLADLPWLLAKFAFSIYHCLGSRTL